MRTRGQLTRWLGILVLVVSSGCAHSELLFYNGYGIRNEPLVPKAGEGRFSKKGHLLEPKESATFAVLGSHSGNPIIIDDERCWTLFVEVPADVEARVPLTVETPRAFLRRWSCTWGNWNMTEETCTGGFIKIENVTSRGIRAEVTLEFPGEVFRKSGLFLSAKPESWLRGDT